MIDLQRNQISPAMAQKIIKLGRSAGFEIGITRSSTSNFTGTGEPGMGGTHRYRATVDRLSTQYMPH
jgi:hypothetical protein